MCGIAGIAGQHESAWVQRMNSTLAHRGPDDHGEYQSPDRAVSLAMRRLSIIDLEKGHQPMCNEDGTIWIVFNGEIFNAPEIQPWLRQRGHRFLTSHSDTEVVIHLYEEKGPSLLEDLNGMFAFVIHDQRRNLLFGARDRVGIKPLYYWQGSGRFVFASELKSLLTLPFIERAIDAQSLLHYMTLMHVPDAASMIDGVLRLPPAHHFTYHLQSKNLTLRRYWHAPIELENDRSESDWLEDIRAELLAAVRRWTLSDVPIACSLSGGIDSSTVVALLAKLGQSKIKTYTLGFRAADEQSWSEVDLAREVARRWGTEHHEIYLEPQELLADLVKMVWHLDEPYGGGLPSWYVFREMSRDVKVGLTGTGGDELFGNYGKYRLYEGRLLVEAALAWRRHSTRSAELAAGLFSPLPALTNHLPDSWRWIGRGRLLSQLPAILREPFGYYYRANPELAGDAARNEILTAGNGDLQSTASYLQRLYDASPARDLRSRLATVDFRTQLAEEFLFMTDRFSMAHGLEARVPLLDHWLVEKIFRIPPAIRTKSDDVKYLLKKAVADLLPPSLLTAPKKGFVIPLELWLRRELRPLVEQLLSPDRLRKQELFNPGFFEHVVRPHLAGAATFTWPVWAALMFQLWHVVFVERQEVSPPCFDWRALC